MVYELNCPYPKYLEHNINSTNIGVAVNFRSEEGETKRNIFFCHATAADAAAHAAAHAAISLFKLSNHAMF